MADSLYRGIKRRDFLNGIAVAAGANLLPGLALAEDAHYPPALTGLRGSHEGSYQVGHSVRDGAFWKSAGDPQDTGEEYDLVVVGGGISGLSAAHFFRKQAGEKARILILDNHDDFGGHAKRNEFRVGRRTLLGYGGTFSIESPAPYSSVAKGLVQELGIDVSSYSKHVNHDIYRSRGLGSAIFFDKETFGSDKLVPDPTRGVSSTTDGAKAKDPWPVFLAEAPFSEKGKRDYERLCKQKNDYLPGLSSAEKKAKMARVSYANFLLETVGVEAEVVRLLHARPHPLFGLGIDAVSAQDAWGLGLPGFEGMSLDPGPGPGMNYDAIRNDEADAYFFHFPDGNSSIARLLVRGLVPRAIPGSSVDDIITTRARYKHLDESRSPVRIRLNSTVVRVRHAGDPATAKSVEIAYMRSGKLQSVKAANCVLACWNAVIPHIAPELPEAQRKALNFSNKVPIVYTNVVLRNWKAWEKAGVSGIYAPGCFFSEMNLDLPVSLGKYHCPRKPSEPIVVHLMRTPGKPGLPSHDQHRAGRAELLATKFEYFERKIRDQMGRALGPSGLDPAKDIVAITVNRWPHGYAYQYNSLFDPFWLEGGEQPCVVGRKPFGRVAIANADAAAYSYTDAAIDQAYRAVGEITGGQKV